MRFPRLLGIGVLTVVLFGLSLLAVSWQPSGREFVPVYGTVLFMRPPGSPGLVDDSTDELCDDIPRLDHVYDRKLEPDDAEIPDEGLARTFLKGKWSVRPVHIWGVWSEIGCKEPLGWGTAFLAGLYKYTSIWITVEHNVQTAKYFQDIYGRAVATNWYIQDDNGNFHELIPIGCKDGKYCVLQSRYVWGTSPVSLDTDAIVNDVHLGEDVYLYGCSLVGEAVKRYVHYRLRFFCLGAKGIVNSPHTLDFPAGGDVLVSAPAMPGFSGSPIFVYRDSRLLMVGTVNAGISGVFTAINLVNPDTVTKTIEYLKAGEDIYKSQ